MMIPLEFVLMSLVIRFQTCEFMGAKLLVGFCYYGLPPDKWCAAVGS